MSKASSTASSANKAPTQNKKLLAWVDKRIALCKPAEVVWADGIGAEFDRLCELMVKGGSFVRLNPKTHPNPHLAGSHPSDVGRVEDRTFICSR
jgi:phosphoenolpyruvate carboxykinase (GTP)